MVAAIASIVVVSTLAWSSQPRWAIITGAMAVACALDHWELARLPLTVRTRSDRALDVRGQRGAAGGFEDMWLTGEARMVWRGVIT